MEANAEPNYQVSEVQLIYKQNYKASERPKITSSHECYKLLQSIWNMETIGFIEECKMLLLSRANRVLGYYSVSTGGMCGTVVDPKIIFAAALKACATSIILCHNHPSGSLRPSQADILLTKKVVEAGKFLEIEVLDHIILSGDGEAYLSFSDEGIM